MSWWSSVVDLVSDVWDAVDDVVPAVVEVGGALIGQSRADAANRQAAQQTAQMSQEAADILSKGYDEQMTELLAGSKTLGDTYDRGLDAVTGWRTGVADRYEGDIAAGLNDYADALGYGLGSYGLGLGESDAGFRGDLMNAVDEFGNVLSTGYQGASSLYDQGDAAFAQRFAPYEAGGQQALSALSGIVARDPSTLTPSQARALDEYRRGAGARLAASGLRGAGRAGVAAMNEGEAAFLADAYDQNQRRSDQAVNTLASMGYGATGNVANNAMRTAAAKAGRLADTFNTVGAAGLDSSKLAAANTARVGEKFAQTALDTTRDIGKTALTSAESAARYRAGVGGDIAGDIAGYYGNLGNLAANEATIRAGNKMGKATANAGAKTAGGQAILQAGLNSGAGWGQTLGWLGSITAQTIKDAARRSSKP